MKPHILVIEDQVDIAELIALNLRIIGFEVILCHDGLKGLEQAKSGIFDLIVLDLMLPTLDGLQICQQLRAVDSLTPLLMLTARQTETDRVMGLELGADDYLTKPFSVLELQARVKALLRRSNRLQQPTTQQEDSLVTIKNLTINTLKREVTLHNKPLQLTSTEFDLLVFLAKSPGQVFSREQLLNSVWGYNHSGYEHTVNSHINRLRSKIEKDPAKPEYVHTVWGIGYKLAENFES